MKSYTLTIMGLKAKDVLPLIEDLPSYTSLQVTNIGTPEVEPEPKKRKQITPNTILTMTGKKATEGSNREKVLHALEKLEAEYGVGTVTRKQLKAVCDIEGLDSQIFYQLVKDGYIRGL